MKNKIKLIGLQSAFTFALLLLLTGTSNSQVSSEINELELSLINAESGIEEIDALEALSHFHMKNNPLKALDYAHEQKDKAQIENLDNSQLDAMIILSRIYLNLAKIDSAFILASQARELSSSSGSKHDLASSYLALSLVYKAVNYHEKCSETALKALRLYEAIGDLDGISSTCGLLGESCFLSNDLDQAFFYYAEALDVSRQRNDSIGIARELSNVGRVYEAKNELDKYEESISEALKVNRLVGNRLWEAENYIDLAELREKQGRFREYVDYSQLAISIFRDLNEVSSLSNALLELSEYYEYSGSKGLSLELAMMSYRSGIIYELQEVIYQSSMRLHLFYNGINEMDSAYKYLQIQHSSGNSLNLKSTVLQASQIKLFNVLDGQLQVQNLNQQKKDSRVALYVISIGGLLLLITSALISRYRVRAAVLKNKVEIENRELAYSVMSSIKEKELSTELSDRIEKMSRESQNKETKDNLGKLANDFRESNSSETLDEFKSKFNHVHNGFHSALLKDFPDLTPNEKRLSAFMRLSMTTRQISELTGQKVETIETARSRLRKKLGISNTTIDISTFLSKY